MKLAQKELVDFKTGIERQKQDSVINNKIESIVKTHFEIPSEKLKELTIQDYKSKRKYEIAEDGKDIFLLDDTGKPLMKEGKYIAFENDAIDYFKSVFPEKQGNSTPPNVPDANGNKTTVPTGATVDELLKQLYKATTADERNAIQNRLKALEK